MKEHGKIEKQLQLTCIELYKQDYIKFNKNTGVYYI